VPKEPTPEAAAKPSYTITKQKHSCWWEVRDLHGELVCLTVYRKGAREVVRRGWPPEAGSRHSAGQPQGRIPAAAAIYVPSMGSGQEVKVLLELGLGTEAIRKVPFREGSAEKAG
jgi:hypothetical protein